MTAPLRLGLVFDNPHRPPEWCIRLIAQIAAEPRIELAAFMRSDSARQTAAMTPIARLVLGVERVLFARAQSASRADLIEATSRIPIISAQSSEQVCGLDLDVVLDLSAGQGSGIDSGLARHGVWFADFVDPAAGLASMPSKTPVARIALFRRCAGHSEAIGVAAATLNPKFIAARNTLFMCEKAVPLIVRALIRTQAFGAPEVRSDLVHAARERVGFGAIARYLRQLTRDFTASGIEHLRCRTRRRPGMFFLKSDQGPLPDFDPAAASAHISKRDSYFADPFLWDHKGEEFCFFEEFVYASGKGHISAGRLVDGELVDIRPVLQTGYHLSFPFVFESEGELYMLPETSQVRRLEVWKCTRFPDRWERHAAAFEGIAASDSTLNFIDGAWWLFTNISRDPFLDMNSELHLFRVDGPALRQIEPHAFNPVVIDANRARNAGRILRIDGKNVRPCQDNSHGLYGYGLRLMEIRSLSLEDYDEVETRSIAPDFEPGITGCHHLDMRNGRVIIDVRKKVGGYAG